MQAGLAEFRAGRLSHDELEALYAAATGDHELNQPGLRAAVLAASRSILAAQQCAERELMMAAREALERQNSALAQTNSILQATLNATPVGVLVADGGGAVGLRNHRFDLLWSAAADAAGPQDAAPGAGPGRHGEQTVDALLPAMQTRLTQPEALAQWLAAVQRQPEAEHALSCQTTDGRHLHCQAIPHWCEDRAAGMVYNWLDVTDRARAADMHAQVAAAELAAKAKSEFISRASHELRTPLNAVLGFSQLLQINPVIDADAVGPLAAERPVRSLGVVASAPTARVLGDATRVRQVLLNLLSNALKYNRPHGEVATRLTADGARWALAVADNGAGMQAEQLLHLFEPFNRLGAERSGAEGTGLGLAITRRLLRAMNGSIEVSSAPGKGSVFTIRLPAA
jgi:signal transduction histidine kinase